MQTVCMAAGEPQTAAELLCRPGTTDHIECKGAIHQSTLQQQIRNLCLGPGQNTAFLSWFARMLCCFLFLQALPGNGRPELIAVTSSLSSPAAHSLITVPVLKAFPCCRPLRDRQCFTAINHSDSQSAPGASSPHSLFRLPPSGLTWITPRISPLWDLATDNFRQSFGLCYRYLHSLLWPFSMDTFSCKFVIVNKPKSWELCNWVWAIVLNPNSSSVRRCWIHTSTSLYGSTEHLCRLQTLRAFIGSLFATVAQKEVALFLNSACLTGLWTLSAKPTSQATIQHRQHSFFISHENPCVL